MHCSAGWLKGGTHLPLRSAFAMSCCTCDNACSCAACCAKTSAAARSRWRRVRFGTAGVTGSICASLLQVDAQETGTNSSECPRPTLKPRALETSETSIFGQRIDQGAVNLAPSCAASAHQTRKLVTKRGEVFEAVFDYGELALREPAGSTAASAVVELKQRGHLLPNETGQPPPP